MRKNAPIVGARMQLSFARRVLVPHSQEALFVSNQAIQNILCYVWHKNATALTRTAFLRQRGGLNRDVVMKFQFDEIIEF